MKRFLIVLSILLCISKAHAMMKGGGGGELPDHDNAVVTRALPQVPRSTSQDIVHGHLVGNASFGDVFEGLPAAAVLQIPRPFDDGIVIPEIARGFEDVYQMFLNALLVYKPHVDNDVDRIEMPFAALGNVLNGTFDLPGDVGEGLSISTGFRRGQVVPKAGKVEIWICPRFVVEHDPEACHLRKILRAWPQTNPVGVFFIPDHWDMRLLDYAQMPREIISGLDLFSIWRKAAPFEERRPSSPYPMIRGLFPLFRQFSCLFDS